MLCVLNLISNTVCLFDCMYMHAYACMDLAVFHIHGLTISFVIRNRYTARSGQRAASLCIFPIYANDDKSIVFSIKLMGIRQCKCTSAREHVLFMHMRYDTHVGSNILRA